MNLDEVEAKFKPLGIRFSTGGIMSVVDNVKTVIDADRTDRTYKRRAGDNFLKHSIEDSPYLIVDIDNPDKVQAILTKYPSLNQCFHSTTTQANKRHYYLLPPEGKEWPIGRKIHLDDKAYDLLSFGVCWEGHATPNYSIKDKYPPAVATEAEYTDISKLFTTKINKGEVHYKHRPIVMNKRALRAIAKEYPKITQKQRNTLIKSITNKEYRAKIPKNTNKIKMPPLTHTHFLTMIFKLTYSGMSGQERDAFLNKLLATEYDIDPQSTESIKRLSSMTQSLPYLESIEITQAKQSTAERLAASSFDGDFGPAKIAIAGHTQIVLVDLDTHKLREIEDQQTIISTQMLGDLYQEHIGYEIDLGAYLDTLPRVKLVNNPFKTKLYMDYDNNIMCLNQMDKSKYYIDAVSNPNKPKNVLTALGDSSLGIYQRMYWVWLAHLMYGEHAPQMFFIMYSGKTKRGASGKTALTSHIPSRLCTSAVTINLSKQKADFSVAKQFSHHIYNDITELEQWHQVYAQYRNESTGGQRSVSSNKFEKDSLTTDASSMSASMNFVPFIDSLDRRSFMVTPQHLEPNRTKPLNETQASELHRMLELTPLAEEDIPELQELANWLLYIFQNTTKDELRQINGIVEPTEYWQDCVAAGKSNSASLLISIERGPEYIRQFIDEADIEVYHKLITFLVYQATVGNKAHKIEVSLPKEWFWEMLTITRNSPDQLHKKTATIQRALGKEDVPRFFRNPSERFKQFKLLTTMKEFPNGYQGWTLSTQASIDIESPVLQAYHRELEEMK